MRFKRLGVFSKICRNSCVSSVKHSNVNGLQIYQAEPNMMKSGQTAQFFFGLKSLFHSIRVGSTTRKRKCILTRTVLQRCAIVCTLHTIQQLESDFSVNVFPPVLAVVRDWYFPVRPLAGQMYAYTRDYRRTVLQAERCQVQAG